MNTTPKILLAPIRGVTNCIYRNVYSKLFDGLDGEIAPFLKSCNVSSPTHKLLRDIYPERNDLPYKLVPQVLTKKADDFIVACTHLSTLGYKTVNWNLGCPHRRVRSRLHGAGMLPYSDKIREILDKVFSNVKTNISIKVRLGNESKDDLPKLLPLLDAYPLEEIIIHPRTGAQMYSGSVDLDAFEKCLNLTKHKVVYNGDIDTVDKFQLYQNRFKTIETWMIGRGAIINPFLVEDIKGGEKEDYSIRLNRFAALHNELLKVYDVELSGWSHKAAKLKEYWYYWSQAFEKGMAMFDKVTRTRDRDDYQKRVNHFFSSNPSLLI